MMALAVAQLVDVAPEETPNTNYVDPQSPVIADDGDMIAYHNGNGNRNRFIAWASPGLKGHKQVTKNTRGCYILDGGAVGSYEGDSSATYGFFDDDRCRGDMLYGWDSAPVNRIDPIIYPRSVKIYENGPPPPPPPPPPQPTYTLVAWSESVFGGDRQLVSGKGCRPLSGCQVSSFQGEFTYRFFDGDNCYGREIFSSQGGRSEIPRIYPRSVYVY
ncbi:hypothetical protein BGZ76_010631 [Entomortierella beljakovae]|nr:hypothetical protein BGZ76_010631 [Entomortierella beljakovae]